MVKTPKEVYHDFKKKDIDKLTAVDLLIYLLVYLFISLFLVKFT